MKMRGIRIFLLVLMGLFINPFEIYPQSKKKPRNLTGHYRLSRGEQRNSLEVESLPGGKIKFHILALWVSPYNPENVHNGEVTGVVSFKNNVAVYTEQNCKLTFRFTATSAVVTQADEVGDCDFGANVSASGTYRKLNSRRPVIVDP